MNFNKLLKFRDAKYIPLRYNLNGLIFPGTKNCNEMSGELCQGCGKPIRDRFLLNTLGGSWHEDCLKCACCEARLGEVGDSLYTKANLILCKRDYLRLFGSTGHCAACNKAIPAFEMVMRAKQNVYHLECFACQLCGHRYSFFFFFIKKLAKLIVA